MKTKLLFLCLALLGGVSSWAGTKITYDFQAAANANEEITSDGNTSSLTYYENSKAAFNYLKDTETLKLFKHFASRSMDGDVKLNGWGGLYSSNSRELAILDLSVGDKVTFTFNDADGYYIQLAGNTGGKVSAGGTELALWGKISSGTKLTVTEGSYIIVNYPRASDYSTSKGKRAIQKIEIEYSDGTVDKVLPPTITSELDGLNANVTITAQKTMLGAWPTTYYTTDGNDPTSGSSNFAVEKKDDIVLANSGTVKAFSKVGENASAIVSEALTAGMDLNYIIEEYDFANTPAQDIVFEGENIYEVYSYSSQHYYTYKVTNDVFKGRFALGKDNPNSSVVELNGSALYFNANNSYGVGMVIMNLKAGDKITFTTNKNDGLKAIKSNLSGFKTDGSWENIISGTEYEVATDGNVNILGRNWVYVYKIIIKRAKTDVTISTAGLSTFCCNGNVDFSGIDNLKAYKASVSGSTVTLTSVTTAAKGEGVLLRNTSDGELTEKTYTIPVATTAVTKNSGNEFVGTLTNITVNQVDGDYTNFVLSKEGDVVGFFKAKTSGDGGTNVGAGKAYLPVLTSGLSEARRVSVVFDDETTAIDTIQTSKSAVDGYYDLQGRRVTQPMKGLYIVNGKKIVIK